MAGWLAKDASMLCLQVTNRVYPAHWGGGGVVSVGRFLLETRLSAHDKCHRRTLSTLSGLWQVFCGKPVSGHGAGHGGCIRQQSRKHSLTIVLESFGLCTVVSHFRLRLCLAFREAKMSDDTDDHKQSIWLFIIWTPDWEIANLKAPYYTLNILFKNTE